MSIALMKQEKLLELIMSQLEWLLAIFNAHTGVQSKKDHTIN